MRVLLLRIRFRATNDDDDDEERGTAFLREKGSLMSPSVLGVLRVFIVLHTRARVRVYVCVCVCAVYTCASNREDKRVITNYYFFGGTPKANVSFPREELEVA